MSLNLCVAPHNKMTSVKSWLGVKLVKYFLILPETSTDSDSFVHHNHKDNTRLHPFGTHADLLSTVTGAPGVMVIVIENRHCSMSSNPGWGWLYLT